MSSTPPLSSLGIGSGLNSESMISALLSVEHRPIDILATEQTTMKTQVSSVGKLMSLTSAMRDAAQALTSSTLWQTKSFNSSDTSVITGSVATGGASGNYNISVQALASAQTITSSAFASPSSTLNEGKLTIQLGSWSGSSFTAKDGSSAVDIDITGDTSLSAIRDKINAAGAGVTASIVNDANGARLSIRSTETGQQNGFKITASETTDDGDPTTGLSALAYDPSQPTLTSAMSLNKAAANAQATINGIQVESATNTFDNVADGLTFTVGKVISDEVAVTVGDDTASMETAVKSFVTAFNSLASYIKDQTKYVPSTTKGQQGTGGPLQGDRTTVGLLNQLRGIINTTSSASSSYQHLSDLGITMGTDGTLSVSTSKLETALANPSEVAKALATDGSDAGSSGFMDRFRDLGNQVTDSTNGSLTLRQNALNDAINHNQARQDQLTDRLSSYEARLRAQYQALDTQMASLTALNTYVNQQMSALIKSSG
ncbi:flagellar filament capping protein FliD [Ideonella dechloratans]|uniref:Flagellar hook-associated protein 2 n=1 Tax=Ideonella dechloratans TaxID=36863 RepID=A0A643F7K0_IDEDE|nr:flagellar filament capping protein FliD [Ideonella dechloratans]KAB0573831.1 flagellar filament capping protein FliD [Ideonella dechloratans]UFU09234.1 flagellar filament capping protein FliD [Ideonella dechloratans]